MGAKGSTSSTTSSTNAARDALIRGGLGAQAAWANTASPATARMYATYGQASSPTLSPAESGGASMLFAPALEEPNLTGPTYNAYGAPVTPAMTTDLFGDPNDPLTALRRRLLLGG